MYKLDLDIFRILLNNSNYFKIKYTIGKEAPSLSRMTIGKQRLA